MDLLLQALNETFDIIHVKESGGEYQILKCVSQSGKKPHVILRFERKEAVKCLLPLFHALQENKVYEDYQGCFSQNEELYLVFVQREGIPLTELLEEEKLSLEERIQVGRRVLERFLLWKLPDFLVCQLLDPDRVLMCADEAAFSYEWEGPICIDCGMKEVNRKMAAFFKALFQEETECSMSPGLMALLNRLEENVPEDIFAVYEAYSSLYDTISAEAGEYESDFLKVKRKCRILLQKGEGVIKVGIFLVGYAAALLLLLNAKQERDAREEKPEEGIRYETIGTLRIK